MWFEDNEPFQIDQDHAYIKDIKDIIKDQGVLVCRNEMSREYIISCLRTFDIGFVILAKKTPIEQQQRTKSSRYILKGFVLFRYEEYGGLITGKILCGRDGYNGIGRKLMECVNDFAIENRVRKWLIFSLPNEKLIKYYEDAGFTRGDIFYRNEKRKVCEMIRTFYYDKAKLDEENNRECLLLSTNNLDENGECGI